MNKAKMSPSTAEVFHFGRCHYDAASGELSLAYRYDDGAELVEKLHFPDAPRLSDPDRLAALQQAFRCLHWIAGVSYYKAMLPPTMAFDGPAPSRLAADFLTRLYVRGLAEFSFVNQVDVAGRVQFVADEAVRATFPDLDIPERALVAMGGGKDSLVGLELMRASGLELLAASVGTSSLIEKTVAAAGVPLLQIHRQLAPELTALNAAGAWNGHVPVTAINSSILVCAAILYGYRYVVFSNERSADEATLLTADGVPVNHQYSKTSEFEDAFRHVVHSMISPGVEYFSILRPFSELHVVRQFRAMTAFHQVYSSCNRNFHQGGPRINTRWCGNCPKCRFAALSLAVFLEPADVLRIQGADMLGMVDQLEGFRAICGLGREKPFECVGEIGESRAALAALASRESWRGHVVVETLLPSLAGVEVPSMDSLLKPSSRHHIPRTISKHLAWEFS